jgi:hypothetical protein
MEVVAVVTASLAQLDGSTLLEVVVDLVQLEAVAAVAEPTMVLEVAEHKELQTTLVEQAVLVLS